MAKTKGWGKVPRRENYKPFSLGDTANLSNEEWLKWREHGSHYDANDESDPYYLKRGYGGSSIGAIFNVSQFTTAKELYDKKTGVVPQNNFVANSDAMELGHIYEPAIANAFKLWWSKEYPDTELQIVNDTRMYRHGKKNPDGTFTYPWAVVNCDRLIKVNGEWGILEIKRTSPRNVEKIENWKRGIPPRDYELQVRYYLAVMNLQYAYICCSWGHLLEQMAVIRIDRDYDIEEQIMRGVADFDEMIENGIEPNIEECEHSLLCDYYQRLYGVVSNNNTLNLSDRYTVKIQNAMKIQQSIDLLSAQKKALEKQQDEIFADLIPLFVKGESTFGRLELDENTTVYVNFKQSLARQAYDIDRLKADHPDIWEQYKVETLDATAFKKKNATLAGMYELPREKSKSASARDKFEFKVVEKGVTA